MATRLGLLGGSFNPIHHGHLIAARSIAEQARLDRILLIPSASPPHKPSAGLAPAADRLEMARLAVAGDPLFEVSDVELHRAGPSYTFDTITELQARLGTAVALVWIIGADTLPELSSWSRAAQLVERVEFVTAARPGFDPALLNLDPLRRVVGEAATERLLAGCRTTPRIEISASEVRRRVAAGLSIRYLVPDAVEEYIAARGLFR